MRVFRPIYALLLIFGLTIQSCQKELSINKAEDFSNLSEGQLQKIHRSKVETWIKLMPIDGHIKNNTNILTKTINLNVQLVTRMQIGDKGSSLLFISTSKMFHVYGLNTKNLSGTHTGIVEIFDFQSLNKKGLRFSNGKLSAFVNYPNESLFNAYQNKYNIDQYRTNKNFTTGTSVPSLVGDGGGLLSIVRKFFCELFGGYWAGSVAENGGVNGTCFTASNGEGEPQLPQGETGGGGESWGVIYPNINNVDFFDFSSQMWNNIIAGLNAGNTAYNWAITTPVSYIDPECDDPDKIRALFFTLNTKYNQQPAMPEFGSLEETFDEFKSYKDQQQVAIPIIPWLLKAGANGAADALMQSLFIYLTEDDCPSFGAAFGHDKFSKTQVTRSAAEGLIPWRTPGGKLGRAAFTAIGDVMVNLIDGKYGSDNYQLMGQDFMLGFFSDLAGGAAGELASKYALPNIGKGLLNKFGIHYKTVASWLGGGLEEINKTFSHASAYGGTITATKTMKGFAENKVVVIGRNMDSRVVPFAQNLSQELGFNVVTIKQWSSWSQNLTVEQNNDWIQLMKNEGYTFYDIGLDPRYTSGAATGTPDLSEGAFYSMELNEIFR